MGNLELSQLGVTKETARRRELLEVATRIYASMVSSSVGGVDDLEVALPEASWAVEVAEGLIEAVNERLEVVTPGCCGSCEEDDEGEDEEGAE